MSVEKHCRTENCSLLTASQYLLLIDFFEKAPFKLFPHLRRRFSVKWANSLFLNRPVFSVSRDAERYLWKKGCLVENIPGLSSHFNGILFAKKSKNI